MIPVASLALPRFLQHALLSAGYHSLDDLDGVHPDELARDLKIAPDTAQDVLRQAEYRRAGPSSLRPRSQLPVSQSQSAASLLRRETATPSRDEPISWSTGSSAIDRLLVPPPYVFLEDGSSALRGVRQGMVLEVASPPGVGKTSLLIRVAISARVSSQAPEVLLVDTEGGMTAPKLRRAVLGVSPSRASRILDGIHLMRIPTQTEMIAFWYTLEDWMVAHPKVKLVCIDTLSFFFRNPSLELATKRRLLEMVKQKIAKVSTVYGCAVLVANQMATKLLTADNKPAQTFEAGERAILMPQLGDLWLTPRTLRLSLFKSGPGDGIRYAHIQAQAGEKGERPWAAFDVDGNGLIVDVPIERKLVGQE